MTPNLQRLSLVKRLNIVLFAAFLLLASLAWIKAPSTAAQGTTSTPAAALQGTATQDPGVRPTATLHPIPELNPNPRQTDGVILGAAVILAVIAAGVWTYGRKRKD